MADKSADEKKLGVRGWLDCVGRVHYPTPRKFIREAQRLGISRRIPLNVLKSMKWGDVIYVGMKYDYGSKLCWKCYGAGEVPQKNTKQTKPCPICRGRGRELGIKKGIVVFGYFYLDCIEGIQVSTQDLRQEGIHFDIVSVSGAGEEVRGCGYREIGGIYAVTSAEVEQLTDLSNVEEASIAGKFYVLPHPWPILTDVKFSRGYRRFDSQSFTAEILTLPKGAGHPEAGGLFKPFVHDDGDEQSTMFGL